MRWAKGDLQLEAWARRLTVPAAIVAVCFLVLRYVQVAEMLDFGEAGRLLDKWDFGIGRMIDFTAVAALAIRFRSMLKPLAIQPLVLLGQASLQVFCVHLVCVFFALTIMGDNEIVRGWLSVVVILISLSALVLTAKVSATRRAKAKANHSAPEVKLPPRIDLDTKAA